MGKISYDEKLLFLLLGGELLTERCRTDDLMPDLPVPNLPPCRVDPKVLGQRTSLNPLDYRV